MKKIKENKGMSLIVFTIILAVLVIIAVGVIVYLLKNPKTEGTQIQNPTNVTSYNSVKTKKENINNLVNLQNEKQEVDTKSNKKFIGNWKVEFGPDGTATIKISEKNNELVIDWIVDYFNTTEESRMNVKKYDISNEKLIIYLENKSNYIADKFIVYSKNDKMYITIEEENDTYFPIEMQSIK